ncbi:hypothetical protein JY651_22855 [Pyxidicoccus parkwayensis]|uniref:HEAT repeat domain-containing protein n=1 Tax=Pyxidicoccus parkwayensis TaxID=2813578 RepID=A0ABX7PAV2_9BACT|nr:hypothetical protein [Pyxidicoccus parkwaysis]QSQ27577.1 hypothetical protein JY651_22855 [Pyxidicoccus parkwaysis]
MSPVRIALKDEVSRRQVESFAWKEGWSMWDFSPGGGLEPFVKSFHTEGDATAAHYLEDPMVDLHYFVVTGTEVDGVVQRIRSKLPHYSRDEVLQQFKTTADPLALARAVRIAGVAAPPDFDPDIFNALREAMSNPDTRVRSSAAAAAAFAAWREFREPLERLSADPEQRVAEVAQTVLRGLQEKHWKDA